MGVGAQEVNKRHFVLVHVVELVLTVVQHHGEMPEGSRLGSRLRVWDHAREHTKEEEPLGQVPESLRGEDLSLVDDVAARSFDDELIVLGGHFGAHHLAALHRLARLSHLACGEVDRGVLLIGLDELDGDAALAAEADVIAHNLVDDLEGSHVTHQAHLEAVAAEARAFCHVHKDDHRQPWSDLAVEVMVLVQRLLVLYRIAPKWSLLENLEALLQRVLMGSELHRLQSKVCLLGSGRRLVSLRVDDDLIVRPALVKAFGVRIGREAEVLVELDNRRLHL